ncbi:MAG TPA: Ig-like domain-containing protein [Polyangiaceae bacterium LLY-WYZ-14_1]|nr:Ig-like domain-containing protein [Polyangiaceae bacterium LLY-WYZ-14_1]
MTCVRMGTFGRRFGRRGVAAAVVAGVFGTLVGACGGGGAGGMPMEEPLGVASTTPADGATGVSVRPTIEVAFSKAMDPTQGTLTLRAAGLEGPVALAAAEASWPEATVVAFLPPTELPALDRVTATLEGFRATDGETLGAPFAFTFTTGADDQSPQLVASTPREGQVDVDPDRLDAVTVTFDEEMDTAINQAELLVGETPETVELRWDDAGTTARMVRGTALPYETAVSLDLTGLQDLGGNPAEGAGDGRLDFMTGPDMFSPFLQNATPNEGARNVRADLAEITVIFSEEMDTGVTAFDLVPDVDPDAGGDPPVTLRLEGTWGEGGLVLTLPVPEPLVFRTTYGLDLRDARDVLGNPVGDDEPFTGDGVLDFTIRPTSGENCEQRLRLSDGETVDGVTTIVLPASESATRGEILVADGGTSSCDNGLFDNPEDSAGADAVIEVVKETPSLSDGGTALSVSVDLPPGAGRFDFLNVEVVTGDACAPAVQRLTERQLWCVSDFKRASRLLDVGPGRYFVFIAAVQKGIAFPGATVRFEEVGSDAVPEGESCFAPFDEDSADFTREGNVRRWAIDGSEVTGFDMARSWGPGSGAMSCAGSFIYPQDPGADVVIEIDKEDPDSLLRLSVEGGVVVYELLADACPADIDGRESVACGFSSVTGPRFFDGLVGRSGLFYLWLSAPTPLLDFAGATVEVEEVPVAEGQACGRGVPLVLGENAVPSSPPTASYQEEACQTFGDPSQNIRWYEYTLVGNQVSIDVDGEDRVILRDRASLDVVDCRFSDDVQSEVSALRPPGSTVCVGVVGSSATTITVTENNYDGPGADLRPTIVPIRPPVDEEGDELLFRTNWLAVDEDTAFGFVPGVSELGEIDLDTGVLVVGRDGITRDNALIDGQFVSGSLFARGLGGNQTYRLWDGVSATWTPIPWDDPEEYPGDVVNIAPDGEGGLFVFLNGDPPVVGQIPPSGGAATPFFANPLTSIRYGRGAATDRSIYLFTSLVPPLVTKIPRSARDDAAPELRAESRELDGIFFSPTVVESASGRTYILVTVLDSELLRVLEEVDEEGEVLRDLGALTDVGGRFAYDPADGRLIQYEPGRAPRLLIFD